MKMEIKNSADVVIVGAGAAGLFAALSLAPKRVLVLSEKPLGGICASCWAQGGIAAAVDKEDTIFSHAADTMKAAAGTADAEVVRVLTSEAPRYIKLLENYGVNFERDEEGAFKLSREACHARRRVLKAAAGDGFGYEMMRALVEAVKKTPSIVFVEGVSAERVIRRDSASMGPVQGVLARQTKDGKQVVFAAPAVILATGGVGGLYAATTNPLGAVGRGIAMAARAGAVLSDLEFVQFHPTALDIGEDPAPLATEALRGEGAYLLNSRGERFMLDYHEMAELAPRDVVSRGIFAQIQRGQKVYLDCRHIDVAHFPALLQACARAKLNPKHDLVPVMPAVHYHMGGVATDLNGRTSVNGLWACGEVAATGLHGANRLASNSLMEAVVMGGRAALDVQQTVLEAFPINVDALPVLPQTYGMEEEKDALRHLMTDLVGVIRDEQGMMKAVREIAKITRAAEKKDSKLADMALVARMVAVAGLKRKESRGGHCRSDYPKTVKAWQKRTFVTLKEIDALTTALLAPVSKRENVA
jgi:L-aspartate oxidase